MDSLCPLIEIDMAEPDTSHAPRTPWYRKVAMAVLIPFIIPAALLGFVVLLAVGLYAFICIVISELLFRIRMAHCGRFLRRRQLSARIAAEGSGTLIVESPSLGWGFTHAWWTPENVLTISPYAVPSDDDYRHAAEKMQCLDWDRWQWENYTAPDKGRAFLLRVWNGRSLERWVKRTFPGMSVVHTWTALVHVQKPAAEPGGA
jgi:hypothetical protein